LLCSWIIAIFKECLIKSRNYLFCLTKPRLVPTIYRTHDEHANHYTTDAVPYFYLIFINFFNQNFLLSFNILFENVLYNMKRKKYKTVCAELAVTKSPSTEWSWFCIELIIIFLYLLCSWIIAIVKECLIKSRNSHCLNRYQVTLIVLD
jgi:hypothetical protein